MIIRHIGWRSQARRIFGAVERLFRKERPVSLSPSSFENSTESNSYEDNRDEAVVVSREDVMVNREDQEYQTRSRRSSERT